MTDKPILFSGPMVQAILREIRDPGTGKTQTRRVLKPQPHKAAKGCYHRPNGSWVWVSAHRENNGVGYSGNRIDDSYFLTPYELGDRLWVREAHYLTDDGENGYAVYAAEQGDVDEHLANMQTTMASHPSIDWSKHLRLRPSIHMSRWASRITLEVTDVRVQRLQEISGADAASEGCQLDRWITGEYPFFDPGVEADNAALVRKFRTLWDSLNAERAPWASNPWIVAVTFRPHLCNIDQMRAVA